MNMKCCNCNWVGKYKQLRPIILVDYIGDDENIHANVCPACGYSNVLEDNEEFISACKDVVV